MKSGWLLVVYSSIFKTCSPHNTPCYLTNVQVTVLISILKQKIVCNSEMGLDLEFGSKAEYCCVEPHCCNLNWKYVYKDQLIM